MLLPGAIAPEGKAGGFCMTCFYPLKAYRLINEKTLAGRNVLVFNKKDLKKKAYEPISLSCGQCIGCRIAKSRDWALRCVHEAQMNTDNCFITLTYNDENLNEFGSLDKRDFQLFMKRLRKRFAGQRIRFFHCGEYGEGLQRPHHHACIFGFDFPDKELWTTKDGNRLYRSEILEEIWQNGYCLIGDVTFQSAAYVARYINKKINGKRKEAHYKKINKQTGEVHEVVPEYITMSRRPGIGKEWFKKFKSDIYPKDFVTHKGKRFKPPAYYDRIYDIEANEKMNIIKNRRKRKIQKDSDNNTSKRLKVREYILKRKISKLERAIEC